jgi:hypothetical protein
MHQQVTAMPSDRIDDIEPASPLAEVDLAAGPTLITEQEVLLSTAAAVATPQPSRWWTRTARVVAAGMRPISATSAADSQPKRRHRPPRATYLEYARMERETRRL